MAMIVFPENLSYDWQMGSIPLITSVRDHRNLLTLVLIASILLICVKCRHLIFDMIKSILTAVNAKQEPKVFQNSCHSVHVSDENDEVCKSEHILYPAAVDLTGHVRKAAIRNERTQSAFRGMLSFSLYLQRLLHKRYKIVNLTAVFFLPAATLSILPLPGS